MKPAQTHHDTRLRFGAILFIAASTVFASWMMFEMTNSLSAAEKESVVTMKPVASTGTGLLLEPPVDLAKLTREEFLKISASIGTNRINKPWTSAVTPLPPHARAGAQGLTESEVQDYMLQVRRLFDAGDAIPVSDVGLISTQEDVIRRPMFNHVAVFSNATAHVYLLVQKTIEGEHWGYFSIVQDLTVKPPINYFAEIKGTKVHFEAVSCYKCHASGPLAIHPTREDLVNDPALLAAFNAQLIEQPIGRMHYPKHDPAPEYGKPMELKFCAKCHADDGERGALYKAHSHSIRVLTDFGHMPPKHRLTPTEIAELKAWLDAKP